MAGVVNIPLSKENYLEQLKELESQRDYLKEFIKTASTERLKDLENKEEQLKEALIRLEEKDKTIQLLQSETDKRVKLAVSSKERELRVEYERKLDDKGKNSRRDIRVKEVKPLENKITQVEEERDRIKELADNIKEMYDKQTEEHTEMLKLLRELLDTVDTIKELVSKEDINKEEIVQTIEKVEKDAEEKEPPLTEEEKIELHNEILTLRDTLTLKDISELFILNKRRGFKTISSGRAYNKVRDYYNGGINKWETQ